MKKIKLITTFVIFAFLLIFGKEAYNIYINYYENHKEPMKQEINVNSDGVLDEITENNIVSQDFTLDNSNKKIEGIAFRFGTYGRQNSSDLKINITDQITSKIIYEETIKASELVNDEYKEFKFKEPLIVNKINIKIMSNAKTPDDAVTMYLSNKDYDKNDSMYINGTKVNGSLCSYITYTKLPIENTTFVLIWIGISILISLLIYIIIHIAISYLDLFKNINRYISNFNKYMPLLRELVVKEIKLKYKRSILGFAWSILNPLLMMCVMTVVFSTLFKSDIQNFPVYLILGQIIFNFYSDATNGAMNAVVGGAGLITKVYIPKYIFPMAKVLSALVNLLFSLIAVVIVIVVTKVNITSAVLLFPVGLVYVTIFALGIGLILSAYSVFFRDINHLYGVLLLAWTYLTPIFYPISIIPENILFIVKANPMYCYISYFRQIVLQGTVPSFKLNLVCILYGVIALIIGTIVFYKKQDEFILYL
ncbi:ABC transporter [Clostridium carnis]|uniref:Transport permease protein n=1 Tax=Clostridium carnis TaxID=1530 RepID=A0ABY6SPS2_9CLOT|nr:ABC transporter permease [Clostridium carnis]VDG69865.1 ABC transporter [Clostridium carnis]